MCFSVIFAKMYLLRKIDQNIGIGGGEANE
jgi:hypothetical protein